MGIGIAVPCLVAGLAACGSGNGNSASGSTTKSTSASTTNGATATTSSATATSSTAVNFIWSPTVFREYFAATKENYWQKYHVDLKPIDILNGGASVMSALASKSADMALVGDGPVVAAAARGLHLDVIDMTFSQAGVSGLYANPKSGITSDPATWKGKKIADVKGSGSTITLHMYMTKKHVTPSNVTLVYTTPAEIPDLYAKGTVTGSWVFDTPALELEADGAKTVLTEAQGGINANDEILVVLPTFLQQHKAAVVHTLEALLAGRKYAESNVKTMASYISSKIGLTLLKTTFLLTDEHAPTATELLAKTGAYSLVSKKSGVAAALEDMGNGLKNAGLIPSVPSNLTAAVVSAPMAAAAKALKAT